MPKRKRGGRRPGAGRPLADPAGRKERLAVYYTPTEILHLQWLGGGDARAGLRRLLTDSVQARAAGLNEQKERGYDMG
jgi:hypothetical protein